MVTGAVSLAVVVLAASTAACAVDDRMIAVRKVDYTFDTGVQGWALNAFPDPRNLGAVVRDGVPVPTLVFESADGDPGSGPGCLKVTVRFTAPDQYVDAIIPLPPPGIDLSGRKAHAMVKLVSGSFAAGGLQIHAASGPSFIFAGAYQGGINFPVGQWVPVTLDLGAVMEAGFDPSQIMQIGIEFSVTAGVIDEIAETVFEIDSVTD